MSAPANRPRANAAARARNECRIWLWDSGRVVLCAHQKPCPIHDPRPVAELRPLEEDGADWRLP